MQATAQDAAFVEAMNASQNPVVWRSAADLRAALEELHEVGGPIVEGLTE